MQGEIRISPSEMEVRVSQYKTQGDAVQEEKREKSKL